MEIIHSMTAGELGQIIGLSGAIVASLILGVKALQQTRNLQEKQLKHSEEAQQREYKQRILDEIIAWAVDVSNSYSIIRSEDAKDDPISRIDCAENTSNRLKLLENRGRYIKLAATSIDESLGDIVLEVLKLVEGRKKLLWESVSAGSFRLDEAERVTAIGLGKESDTTGLSKGALNSLALGNNARSLSDTLDRIIGKAVDIKMQSTR
jgi:hypothetical protein